MNLKITSRGEYFYEVCVDHPVYASSRGWIGSVVRRNKRWHIELWQEHETDDGTQMDWVMQAEPTFDTVEDAANYIGVLYRMGEAV